MFVRMVLSAENSVFGRVRRLNRYLSVAFFLSGIPVLKTVLPMDGYPCFMPQESPVRHLCYCKFSDFLWHCEEI